MLKALTFPLAGVLLASVNFPTWAQSATNGTITKIDEAHGTIQLRFAKSGTTGDLPSDLNEEFPVKNGLHLNGLQSGDKVQFLVGDVDGKRTLIEIHKQ